MAWNVLRVGTEEVLSPPAHLSDLEEVESWPASVR